MKNKLWSYGCSFTTGFNGVDFYNDNLCWYGILAKKLGLELNNSGKPNQCNWVSILHFLNTRDEIKTGDVVIFEFTFFDRFNIFPLTAQLENLQDFIIQHHKGNLVGVGALIKDYIYNWFVKHVFNYCKERNIELYCWSLEGQTHVEYKRYSDIINFIPAPNSTNENPNYAFYTEWQQHNQNQWARVDHDMVLNDTHFNVETHDIVANHIFECINTYKK